MLDTAHQKEDLIHRFSSLSFVKNRDVTMGGVCHVHRNSMHAYSWASFPEEDGPTINIDITATACIVKDRSIIPLRIHHCI